jgi:hypothetical protein
VNLVKHLLGISGVVAVVYLALMLTMGHGFELLSRTKTVLEAIAVW